MCETLVIDTMDWAERLCVEDVLSTHGKKGIEDFGYGNGYVYVAEAIGRFLNLLQELIDKDICNVVLNCHSHLKNIMYKDLGVEGYVDINRVRECRQAEDLEFWKGRRVWLGLDLSQTDDNTVFVNAWRNGRKWVGMSLLFL